MRLKQRIERQAMPLLRCILRRENRFEFIDQRAHVVRCARRKVDPHAIAVVHRCSDLTLDNSSVVGRARTRKSSLIGLDRCPLCLDNDQLIHRAEMARCAKRGSGSIYRPARSCWYFQSRFNPPPYRPSAPSWRRKLR